MGNALNFQKWFSRFIILFVIWNCVGLRYSVSPEPSGDSSSHTQKSGSFSLFLKETPGLKLIYIE